MSLPRTDTRVLYPDGSTSAPALVLHLEALPEGREAVVLDATPFHPVDAGWPDQGADRGILRTDRGDLPILDAVLAATDGETLFIGADAPVRPGADGWAFLVAHVVAAAEPGVTEGETVTVIADADYRRALSIGHTACHLASLALNRAMADRWTKEVRSDGLGQPDFDASAITSSLITPGGSVDVFRLNKSLRRKGFSADGLEQALPELEAHANRTLAEWVATGAPVRIDRDGQLLTDRRFWVCELPEASVSIACGGTHVTSLAELGDVRVSLALGEQDGSPTLTMRSDAAAA
ncbi:metal-dependent hydrolase [Rathayibacter sp. YIM 133350]|uniref:metal-dependent hydrolase n=1 Tax=Rathayibacter sp. YIM 133350 TaxID=3131992 RepID=UPI00307DB071